MSCTLISPRTNGSEICIMKRLFMRVLGICLSVIGLGLFVVFTSSINAAQSLGGPMNMSPSPREWCYIVLTLDLVFLAIAIGGMKLASLSRSTVGLLAMAVGVSVLTICIWNHVDGPPVDIPVGPMNNHGRIPVSPEENTVVYVVAGLCLGGGFVFITVGKFKRVLVGLALFWLGTVGPGQRMPDSRCAKYS